MNENESCPVGLVATGSIHIVVAWSGYQFSFFLMQLFLNKVFIFFLLIFCHVRRLLPVGFHCAPSIQILLISMIDGKMAQLNPKRWEVRRRAHVQSFGHRRGIIDLRSYNDVDDVGEA